MDVFVAVDPRINEVFTTIKQDPHPYLLCA